MPDWFEFIRHVDDPHDEIIPHYSICKRHMVYSTFPDRQCFLCAQERRTKTYQDQKSGVYYERELGYNPNQT